MVDEVNVEQIKFPDEQIHFSGEQVNFPGEQRSLKYEEIRVLMGHIMYAIKSFSCATLYHVADIYKIGRCGIK